MSYLVLLRGGVPGWQVMGHPGPEHTTLHGIAIPRNALFSRRSGSAECAAEFHTRDAAAAAITASLGYFKAQHVAGYPGFESLPRGVEYVIVEVPS